MVRTGQRYVSPGGAEMVVTKGGDGDFFDGETPLQLKGGEASFEGIEVSSEAVDMALGKRFSSPDGSVSVLVTKAGAVRPAVQRGSYGTAAAQGTAFFRLAPFCLAKPVVAPSRQRLGRGNTFVGTPKIFLRPNQCCRHSVYS